MRAKTNRAATKKKKMEAKRKDPIPGEIVDKIVMMYFCYNTDETHPVKGTKVACINKAYRDVMREDRFHDITVGYPTNQFRGSRSLLMNSSNAAKINREIAWTEKNQVSVRPISFYADTLKYADSVELVKLFLTSWPLNCVNFVNLTLSISSKFVKKAPASYLFDLVCFLGMVNKATTYMSHGNTNTLRFHYALKSIKNMQMSLKSPRGARSDYMSETFNDIAKCINCTRLFLIDASSTTSSSFRKLTMHLTRMTIDSCDLLTDSDLAWFLNRNKLSLTHCYIDHAECETLKIWQALGKCTQLIDFRFECIYLSFVPFPLIAHAIKQLPKLQRLNIVSLISDASEEAMLDLMLTYSRGGVLYHVNFSTCSGLDDSSLIKNGLTDAYRNTPASIQMTLNLREVIWTNPKLDTFDFMSIYED